MAGGDEKTELRAGGASERQAPRFVSGELLGGRYRIVAPLGRGGMGEVYRAEDVRLGQQVALKFLPASPAVPAVHAQMIERLVSEVRIGRQISHPNVCRLYDLVETPEGLHFIAMEFVEGEDLASLLRRIGRVPGDKAIALAHDLCAGLAAAHDRGVIHRDLKPANVMIDEHGHARITDFGLALARSEARHGDWAGTPGYMAPEQLTGAPAGVRSDLYSLGLVLYEMFTGQRVFEGNQDLRRVHQQPKAPPSAIVHDIDPTVERLILACIDETAERRPSSARELLAQLPVTTQTPQSRARSPVTSSGRQESKSVAVLPFEDLSPDKSDEYFSAGLAEEIISDLSKIGALRVISRGSVMRFRSVSDVTAVARELNVAYVLTGSMRRAGNQLRVTANLIDGRTDSVVWSEKFRGAVDDVFDVQETVARGVAEQLKIKLSDEESARIAERPIPNVLAYEYFLKARSEASKFTRQGIDRALDLLNKGIEIVGPNVHLYAAMAYARWQYFNAGIDPDEINLREAEEWAAKIDELDSDSPHKHRVLGLVAMSRGDVASAMKKLTAALRGDPNDTEAMTWLSISHSMAGHADLASALADRVVRLDPLGSFAQWAPCLAAWFSGRFHEAAAVARTVWEAERDNVIAAHAHVYMLVLARDAAASGALSEMETHFGDTYFTNLTRLVFRAAAGDREGALSVVTKELEESSRRDCQYSMTVAEGLAMAAETERALEFLETAVKRGNLAADYLENHDWMLDPIKVHPRFGALMRSARERSAALRLEIEGVAEGR